MTPQAPRPHWPRMHRTPRGEALRLPPGASTHRPTESPKRRCGTRAREEGLEGWRVGGWGARADGDGATTEYPHVSARLSFLSPSFPRARKKKTPSLRRAQFHHSTEVTSPRAQQPFATTSPHHHYHDTTDCRHLHGAHHTLRTHIHTDPNTHLTLARV